MYEFTLPEWMARGFQLVEQGQTSVRIMGRRPTRVQDEMSPAGEYGWQFGWRWQDDTATASHTIPEALYKHLPGCPIPEVTRLRDLGRGVMLRWPTEAEALAILDQAAMAWAKELVAGTRKVPADVHWVRTAGDPSASPTFE